MRNEGREVRWKGRPSDAAAGRYLTLEDWRRRVTEQEQKAVMTLVLMAAFADDRNEPTERQEVTRVAESLSHGGGVNVAAIYQDVLLKRATLDDVAAELTTPDVR